MSKEKQEDPIDEPDPDAWMATFSDLITLLITFFVLILSMSSLDAKPLKDTFGFFDQRIGVLHMSKSQPQNPLRSTPVAPPIYDNKPQEERVQKQMIEEGQNGIPDEQVKKERAMMGTATSQEQKMNEIREIADKIKEDSGELEDLFEGKKGISNRDRFEQMLKLFKNPRYEEMFTLLKRGDNLTVHFAGELLFRPGRVLIRPESLVLLREIGALLEQLGVDVRIVGIVPGKDAPPPVRKDLYPDQWALAIARSCNVVRYMTTATRVSTSRVSGSVRPLGETGVEEDGVFFELRMPAR